MKQAKGIILIDVENSEDLLFSEHFACVHCQINLGELEPRTFSYNNPHGACNTCAGLGFKKIVDPDLVIPDYSISIDNGGIEAWSMSGKLNPFLLAKLTLYLKWKDFELIYLSINSTTNI